MKQGIHSGITTISLVFAAIAAPAIAVAQDVVLDASVLIGAEKPQKRQYTAMVGKEITLEENGVYRVVMIPTSLTANSVLLEFRMLQAGSGRGMAGGTKIAPLGKKEDMLLLGRPGSPDRFWLEAIVRLK